MDRIQFSPAFFNQKTESPLQNNNTPHQVQQKFSQMLKNAIHKVNESQVQSDIATEKLINGQAENLHDVMIAAEKAAVTLQVTLEIRNKAIEAYQEIMRMPV